MNYYNEFDPQAAQWLRNLISAGLIPPGDVDERSIEDVTPNELTGYAQCHFFAGIGGWPLALALAGWPADRPVWTGSCPCQPFSAAGRGDGFADQRHLWPAWFHLIRECRPSVVFGEQVASAVGHGWLDLVSSDLEAQGYACGAAVLGAHSVGAPHIRQRLYFVADASASQRQANGLPGGIQAGNASAWDAGVYGGLSDAVRFGQSGQGWLFRSGDSEAYQDRKEHRTFDAGRGAWSGAIAIPCADGPSRLIEPGLEPLAHGIPARVVRLRAYGNAIVPQVAAAFIGAFADSAAMRAAT